MIKVLIYCENNNFAKYIVNFVISRIADLRLIGIANTEKEGSQLLNKYEPGLIFTTAQSFVEYINEITTTYSPGIILISKPIPDRPICYRFKNLFLHIKTTNDLNLISDKTIDFISNKFTKSRKKEIKKILEDIGFDFKLNGTCYLLDTLLYLSTYQGTVNFNNLISKVYPLVGKKNGTSANVVKWAITRSINYLYEKNNPQTFKKMEKYFGIKAPEKITPKNFIKNMQKILDK